MAVTSSIETFGDDTPALWEPPSPLATTPLSAPADSGLLLAQANTASRPQRSWTDIAGDVLSAGTPDAIVYSNAALLAPANAKSFVLANPVSGNYTHFISHPQNTVNVLGVNFGRVEAIHYNTNGTGTRREDGFGYVQKAGQGQNQVTFFINGRLGDTNVLNNPNNGVSVNFGFFGSPAAVRQLIDRLPAAGKAGKLKEALEALIATASAGGTQLGVAWRGTLQMNRETGKVELNVSGVKIPLAELQNALRDVNAINYGNKPIARVNNEEAYLNGANPFQRADDTRVSNGAYVNHGDPVAAIAGDILTLQDRVLGAGERNIRTNDEARSFIETALVRSTWITPEEQARYRQLGLSDVEGVPVSAEAMSREDRAKLQGLLVQLHQNGLYFGSPTIEAAARTAALGAGAQPADAESRKFVRDVYQGRYRFDSVNSYGADDLAGDLALGWNRYVAIFTSILDAGGTARDDIYMDQDRGRARGFEQRMAREGGTLEALGLRVPAGLSRAEAEESASGALVRELLPLVTAAGQRVTAQSLYEQYQQLGSAQKQAIAREIQGELDARGSNASATVRGGDRRTIDGVAVYGGVSRVQAVGGVDPQGRTVQGELMWGRDASGSPVFWLQGRSTNYLLRGSDGQPIANQTDAEARARELIRNGAATDLRALNPAFIRNPSADAGSSVGGNIAATRNIGGVPISGTPSRLESIGGVNANSGAAMQGDLMFARDTSGNLVFWLQGRSTNYVLRGSDGELLRNAVDAEARARELIRNGGATDLRPLDRRFI